MKKLAALFLSVLMVLSLAACGSKVITPPDGQDWAEGGIGDTFRTSWFDFTISGVEFAGEFDGYTPPEGYELVIAQASITNNTKVSLPMLCDDFVIGWNSLEGEEEEYPYDYPVVVGEGDDYEDYSNVSDQQFPVHYDLAPKATQEGVLLFQVPQGRDTFSIAFMEYFDDDSTGDTFYVDFTR